MSLTTPRIDAHLHLWDLDPEVYTWLRPESGDLYSSFPPERIEGALVDQHIDGVILVQAADSPADTAYLLEVAAAHDWVAGVVGWVQLDDESVAVGQLDALADAHVLRGIRHLVHDDPRADFLRLPAVRASLRSVAARGLTFDVPDAWPHHLDAAAELASDIDDLTVVIDHLAKPPTDWAARQSWRRSLAAVAARPNTVAKFSGLRSAVAAGYSAATLLPLWNDALELFGPSRLMWGSDWPVSGRTYAEIIEPILTLVVTLSDSERAAVLGGTAANVYGTLEVAR
ncbi:L-fuconolactonase [Microbacteriaceae bacterium SG_E_30_P1]|uniref:L-fuconolactonase n=1 Tax=Antiquaquibacter oligotrophicus TaxID=2880260 RepID=A0ABT6KS71_9MICO|nr:amidohydrolase family protein [Antiquaquibacter oligotrophicus]MDH6182348.1 L-fuconolactonase [Antiquaquibacter oligotrophicus]UDF11999.1 amidohydrolase family protein [Antiquaquibacter oligotrophicus]